MGLISRLKRFFSWKRDMPVTDRRAWSTGVDATASGVKVTEEKALSLPGLYAAIRNIAEDLASVPIEVVERDGSGVPSIVSDKVLDVLQNPNALMSEFEWRETMVGQMELRGNAYSEIVWNGAGLPIELWPLRSDSVFPFIGKDGGLYYRVSFGGRSINGSTADQVLPSFRVLHLRKWGPNGLVGHDPIVYHREFIGRGLAAMEYGARFFGNGSRPGGILTTEGELTEEQAERMRRSWEEAHSGLSQAHRVAVLEMGTTWKAVGVTPEVAQYIETEKLSTRDAARIWRIPPHMIGDLESATYSNIEQQAREYVKFSLMPRVRRLESRLSKALLPGIVDRSIVFRLDSLLRGDIEARFRAYATARNWGWLSVNEIRQREGLPPVPNGDRYLEPVNMIGLGELADGNQIQQGLSQN